MLKKDKTHASLKRDANAYSRIQASYDFGQQANKSMTVFSKD